MWYQFIACTLYCFHRVVYSWYYLIEYNKIHVPSAPIYHGLGGAGFLSLTNNTRNYIRLHNYTPPHERIPLTHMH
jgi:hypothetical protein